MLKISFLICKIMILRPISEGHWGNLAPCVRHMAGGLAQYRVPSEQWLLLQKGLEQFIPPKGACNTRDSLRREVFALDGALGNLGYSRGFGLLLCSGGMLRMWVQALQLRVLQTMTRPVYKSTLP